MGQYEFWIITTTVLTLISIVIYLMRRSMSKRDTTERQLTEALNNLKEAISQLKISLTTQATGCYERHKALDRELKEIHEDIFELKGK